MKKQPNIIKDAAILFLITVIAGILLGGVYALTKEPIAAAEENAKNKAYKEVLASADEFKECFADSLASYDEMEEGITIENALVGRDSSGEATGYVVQASSSKSYGGKITLIIGMDDETTITGISVLSINDTPGLGMKAKEEDFRNQFKGIDTSMYVVVKDGANPAAGEIDAISSATITSKAFTGAVNGAKAFLRYAFAKEGGEC